MTANDAWVAALTDTMWGETISPRGIVTRERLVHVIYLSSILNSVVTIPERRLNYAFMVAEAAWILSGDNRLSALSPFCKKMAEFSDDGTYLRGAYGPRVVDQLGYVVDTLMRDPFSRQAVMSIWRERPAPSKDIPCTLTIQFLIRGNQQLHTIVNMRSSDVWLGVPYDLFTFSMIAHAVRVEYIRRTGKYLSILECPLTIIAGSRHIYDSDIDKARGITQNHGGREYPPKSIGWIDGCSDIDELINCLRVRTCIPNDIHDFDRVLI